MTAITTRCEPMGHHFTKHHLEGLPVSAVLHHFTAAEPEADPHDHPWGFTSFVLSGGYVEEVFEVEFGWSRTVTRRQGEAFTVDAGHVHRIVRLLEGECWTLVLPGPLERVSGFYRWAEDGTPMYRRWDQQEWGRLER